MPVLIRDSAILPLALRDAVGGQTVVGQQLKNVTLTGAGTYFTEVLDVGQYAELIVFIVTTSHGGTNPTLDAKLQYSPDKVTWIDAGDAFTQITTTDGIFLKKVTANFGKYVRLLISINGTASPNYKLSVYLSAKA